MRFVARSGFQRDEVAGLVFRAVAIDDVALEDQELLVTGMLVGNRLGARFEADQKAALSFVNVVTDVDPGEFRLLPPLKPVGLEVGFVDVDDRAQLLDRFRHFIPPENHRVRAGDDYSAAVL